MSFQSSFDLAAFLELLKSHGTDNPKFDELVYRYVNREAIARKKKEEEERKRREREARQRQEEAERQRKKQLKERRKSVAFYSAVFLVILGFVIYFKVLIPRKEYNKALDYYDSMQYQAALSVFNKLGDFRDSESYREKCLDALYEADYLKGLEYLQSGNYNSAGEQFEKTMSYRDSYSLLNECRNEIYLSAISLMESGSYSAAIEQFESLYGHKDSYAMIERCQKLQMLSPFLSCSWGEIVYLGRYEQDGNDENGPEEIGWYVLENTGKEVLLVSVYGLDRIPYNQNYSSVTWETCSLREWLNHDFFEEAFSEDEQGIIKTTLLHMDKYDDTDADAGNDTYDKLFVFSAEEAYQYFATDRHRTCYPTQYTKNQEVYIDDYGRCMWWLRTPGERNTQVTLVDVTGILALNAVNEYGINIFLGTERNQAAVRPAMWIGLEE